MDLHTAEILTPEPVRFGSVFCRLNVPLYSRAPGWRGRELRPITDGATQAITARVTITVRDLPLKDFSNRLISIGIPISPNKKPHKDSPIVPEPSDFHKKSFGDCSLDIQF